MISPSPFTVSHTIRLRGAWNTSTETEGTRIRHSRNFGWPRPLDSGDQLWLVCSHVPGAAEVLLNTAGIGVVSAAGPFAVDITKAVQLRNTLVFAVDGPDPLGEVTLEVRTPHG